MALNAARNVFLDKEKCLSCYCGRVGKHIYLQKDSHFCNRTRRIFRRGLVETFI